MLQIYAHRIYVAVDLGAESGRLVALNTPPARANRGIASMSVSVDYLGESAIAPDFSVPGPGPADPGTGRVAVNRR
jgi:hypothetical protein